MPGLKLYSGKLFGALINTVVCEQFYDFGANVIALTRCFIPVKMIVYKHSFSLMFRNSFKLPKHQQR